MESSIESNVVILDDWPGEGIEDMQLEGPTTARDLVLVSRDERYTVSKKIVAMFDKFEFACL
jgi:hypothetical protein